ncbi:hypothetical protein TgHK011_007430 [Trichoderma gracile]|nr:hypothetical protein TgHK011_007430 [Trichoderma gracile]
MPRPWPSSSHARLAPPAATTHVSAREAKTQGFKFPSAWNPMTLSRDLFLSLDSASAPPARLIYRLLCYFDRCGVAHSLLSLGLLDRL